MSKLGMVIINYNDYKTTEQLLKNIQNYKCLDSIILVDNKSTDESLRYLKKYENSHIKVLSATQNNGYAAGLNIGAKYLIKKYKQCNIIFSNSDVIINDEQDLQKLSNDINDKLVLVGPTIEEKNILNHGWMMPTIKDEIRFNLPLISRKYKKSILYNDDYYHNHLSLVDVVSGCFFCINSDSLKRINFFDEQTFLYYEEQILSKKLKKINKQIAIDNKIHIIHNHSVTIDTSISRVRKYKELKKSQYYFVQKYLKASREQLFLLKLTKNLSLVILYIRCFFKGGFKK